MGFGDNVSIYRKVTDVVYNRLFSASWRKTENEIVTVSLPKFKVSDFKSVEEFCSELKLALDEYSEYMYINDVHFNADSGLVIKGIEHTPRTSTACQLINKICTNTNGA